jgi:hypothetical protein
MMILLLLLLLLFFFFFIIFVPNTKTGYCIMNIGILTVTHVQGIEDCSTSVFVAELEGARHSNKNISNTQPLP